MKTIAALSAPFPGVSRVLEEGAKLKLWQHVSLDSEKIAIPPAEVYLLGAWDPSYEDILSALRGELIGVLWTSSGGEMGFEMSELETFQRLLDDPRIAFVWCGDPALAKAVGGKTRYAPYPLACDLAAPDGLRKRPDVATLFCPMTLKKNILNQLLAVALAHQERPGLVLHTNVSIDDVFLKRLGLQDSVVQHQWMATGPYHRLLAAASVNLAVSWAETFNYQAAEAVLLGTPVVGSAAIPWLDNAPAPSDPQSIAREILAFLALDLEELALSAASLRMDLVAEAKANEVELRLFLESL